MFIVFDGDIEFYVFNFDGIFSNVDKQLVFDDLIINGYKYFLEAK